MKKHGAFFQALCFAYSLNHAAVASEPAKSNLDAVEQQTLYLAIVLNQAPSAVLGEFIQTSNDLFIARDTLQALQLNVNLADAAGHAGFIRLSQIAGLNYKYNESAQSIELNVIPSLLQNTTVTGFVPMAAAKVNPLQMKPGMLINYDFYSQATEDLWSLSGWNELRFFGFDRGSFLSVSANYAYSKTDQSEHFNSHILDSYWQKDFADRALTLTVGDSQSRALDWSRSTRISGIKLAKNFNLQPYQVTSPLASFKGSVLLPSTVDLLINGIKQSSSELPPGQFNIQTAPSITGSGTAQLLITDLNGQQRIVDFSLFGTSKLLQQGLSDWDMNVGVNKLNYAVKSFSYGHDLLINASYRYGLSNDTTVESHTEYSKDVALAGFGVVHRLPKAWGILNGSYSYSELAQQGGQSFSVGYEWNNRWLNFSMNHQQSDATFGDLASALGYSYSDRSDHIFVGLNTDLGQFGSSYVSQKNLDRESEYLILNWSYYFPSRSYLSLNMSRDLNDRSNTFFMSLNIPLDRQTNASLNARKEKDRNRYTADIRKTAVQDQPDWGWQANVDYSDTRNYSFQGQLQRETPKGQWDLGFQNTSINSQDYRTLIAGARGSLLAMDSHFFAMRQSLNSFAVVSTQGVPDIPVRVENRLVGKTNAKGLLLLDSLNPYQHNAVTIDPLDLPLEYKIESTQLDAVPQYLSGIYLHFPIYKVRSIQVVALDEQNKPLKMGSPVWVQKTAPNLDDVEHTIVGRDGVIYLENPAVSQMFINQDGKLCRLDLPDFSTQYGYLDLGSLKCQTL